MELIIAGKILKTIFTLILVRFMYRKTARTRLLRHCLLWLLIYIKAFSDEVMFRSFHVKATFNIMLGMKVALIYAVLHSKI
jgi:hypothetical protein